jgi:hypothetical protein
VLQVPSASGRDVVVTLAPLFHEPNPLSVSHIETRSTDAFV